MLVCSGMTDSKPDMDLAELCCKRVVARQSGANTDEERVA